MKSPINLRGATRGSTQFSNINTRPLNFKFLNSYHFLGSLEVEPVFSIGLLLDLIGEVSKVYRVSIFWLPRFGSSSANQNPVFVYRLGTAPTQ